jgi:hypothetical protein
VLYLLSHNIIDKATMLKKTIVTISLLGSLLILLDVINFDQSIILFIFVGAIPGTNLTISPTDMMTIIIITTILVIGRFTIWPKYKKLASKQITAKKAGQAA